MDKGNATQAGGLAAAQRERRKVWALSTAICLLGRYGDLANSLPIARDIFLRTGEKPFWIVSIHYNLIFLGVSYVNPVKVQFAMDRSDLAAQLAGTMADKVLQLQTFGRLWRGAHHLPYNRMGWEHAGYGEHFDDGVGYPLVFDRRDPEREAMLCRRTLRGTKPVLLLSIACGRSSPFPAHGTFSDSIRRKWGNRFEIVDLCQVRAARIYDVLGLFDRAALLVTTDSAPVHLATASPKLPVIFLANNQHFLASDPRCNCVLKLKYDEWHARIKEVHAAIFQTLAVVAISE